MILDNIHSFETKFEVCLHFINVWKPLGIIIESRVAILILTSTKKLVAGEK